jgi:hypothetical protein
MIRRYSRGLFQQDQPFSDIRGSADDHAAHCQGGPPDGAGTVFAYFELWTSGPSLWTGALENGPEPRCAGALCF